MIFFSSVYIHEVVNFPLLSFWQSLCVSWLVTALDFEMRSNYHSASDVIVSGIDCNVHSNTIMYFFTIFLTCTERRVHRKWAIGFPISVGQWWSAIIGFTKCFILCSFTHLLFSDFHDITRFVPDASSNTNSTVVQHICSNAIFTRCSSASHVHSSCLVFYSCKCWRQHDLSLAAMYFVSDVDDWLFSQVPVLSCGSWSDLYSSAWSLLSEFLRREILENILSVLHTLHRSRGVCIRAAPSCDSAIITRWREKNLPNNPVFITLHLSLSRMTPRSSFLSARHLRCSARFVSPVPRTL